MRLQVRAQSNTFCTFSTSITNSHPWSHGDHVMPGIMFGLPLLCTWVKHGNITELWSNKLYPPLQFKLSNRHRTQINEGVLKHKSIPFLLFLLPTLFLVLLSRLLQQSFAGTCCCGLMLWSNEDDGNISSCFIFAMCLEVKFFRPVHHTEKPGINGVDRRLLRSSGPTPCSSRLS